MTDYRIWVGCLAAYNNGNLHGEWIDCEGLDVSELQNAVNNILETSPEANAEEFMIFDTEGFGNFVGEYTPLSDVIAITEALTSVDDPDALLEFMDCFSFTSIVDAIDDFESAYRGHYDSEKEFAMEEVENLGELDSNSLLANYFDYDAYARDLFIDNYIFSNGYVFDRNF